MRRPENEHEGPIWKHPYMLYVIGNVILFTILGLVAWYAWDNGWIPHR